MSASAFARKIFVDRLPWHIASDDLLQYFGKFGKVNYVRVPFDKETGYHKGFGFVVFGHSRFAETVCREEHILGNVKLRVRLSTEKRKY